MKRRAFITLGAASIGAGALHRTGAFSSLSAGRGIAVQAADDPNALLGLEGNDDPAVTPRITNNSALSMTVTLASDDVSFDVTGNGTFEEPATFDLEPGDAREFELEGDDDTVTISAVLSRDGTGQGSITLERPFVVPQVAAIREVVGSVDRAGGSGKYEFSLTNESDDEVTLDGFGIEWTNPDATQVGGRNQDDILTTGGSPIVEEPIVVGGAVVDVIDGEAVTLSPDASADFEFDRFRDDDGGNFAVDDVDLVVRAADGSSAVVELRVAD